MVLIPIFMWFFHFMLQITVTCICYMWCQPLIFAGVYISHDTGWEALKVSKVHIQFQGFYDLTFSWLYYANTMFVKCFFLSYICGHLSLTVLIPIFLWFFLMHVMEYLYMYVLHVTCTIGHYRCLQFVWHWLGGLEGVQIHVKCLQFMWYRLRGFKGIQKSCFLKKYTQLSVWSRGYPGSECWTRGWVVGSAIRPLFSFLTYPYFVLKTS